MPYQTAATEWLFSEETTLDLWRRVELAILQEQAALGQIPEEWAATAERIPAPPVALWRQQLLECGHELVGFLNAWGLKHAHIGVTSSDIIDTALSLRLKDAHKLVIEAIDGLTHVLSSLVTASGGAVRLGRTHGQPATVMRLEQVFSNWLTQVLRRKHNLEGLTSELFVAKVSGPVGSYLHVSPLLEQRVAAALGLNVATSTTQIVTRDPLASYVSELGVLMRVVEAIAVEIRLLSHAAIQEAHDPAGSTSSTMPHKTNPNAYERLTGLSRIVNATIPALTESVVQWHERDLAHSSVERTYLPVVYGTTHYALEHLTGHLAQTRFDPLASYEHLRAFETDALTHSAQYAFQMAGLSYTQARDETAAIYRRELTAPKFIAAIKRHPIKPVWEYPEPKTTEWEIEDVES